MPNAGKLLFTCATHLAALTLGWQAWVLAHPSGSTAQTPPPPTLKREGTASPMSTDDVLAFAKGDDAAAKAKDDYRKTKADLKQRIGTIEVPEDIEAALARKMEEWLQDDQDHRKPSLEIMALMYHWALRDIAAMQRWAETGEGPRQVLFSHIFLAYEQVTDDKGPQALVAGLTGMYGNLTANVMAVKLGLSGDFDQTLALKDSLSKRDWELLRDRFGHTWSMNRKDDIVKLAVSEGQPAMLLRFATKHGAEGSKWLSQILSDGSIDPSFADQITKDKLWDEIAKSARVMSLDERADQMRASGDATRDVISEITRSDLTQLLRDGRDWRFAFRHGEADAAEVLAEISKSLPELASKAPDALRAQLYIEFVEEDPARAAALLETLPAEQRLQVATQAIRQPFADVDPNLFLAALQQLPSDTPELWDARLEAWNNKSTLNLRRLSDDYVAWVRQLPPGLDREMAMFSLVHSASQIDPAVSAEMRAAITDPALKQKLAESR